MHGRTTFEQLLANATASRGDDDDDDGDAQRIIGINLHPNQTTSGDGGGGDSGGDGGDDDELWWMLGGGGGGGGGGDGGGRNGSGVSRLDLGGVDPTYTSTYSSSGRVDGSNGNELEWGEYSTQAKDKR